MVDKVTAGSAAPAVGTNRGLNIALWVLQVILALAFVGSGVMKLTGDEQSVLIFQEMGTDAWMPYLIGALEVLGAIGLLIPRLTRLAAFAFVALMVGAVISHLIWGGPPALPIVLAVLAAVVAWGRTSAAPLGKR